MHNLTVKEAALGSRFFELIFNFFAILKFLPKLMFFLTLQKWSKNLSHSDLSKHCTPDKNLQIATYQKYWILEMYLIYVPNSFTLKLKLWVFIFDMIRCLARHICPKLKFL